MLSCAGTGGRNADGLSIAEAIDKAAEQIAEAIPARTRPAVIVFESENENLSNFIIDELSGALFDRRIEAVERNSLEHIYREQHFQLSGDVSEETAMSIGKFVGAEIVVIGQIRDLGSGYRFIVNAIH